MTKEGSRFISIAVGFLLGAVVTILIHGAVYVTELRDLQRRVGAIESREGR